jgi:hypothetical protein
MHPGQEPLLLARGPASAAQLVVILSAFLASLIPSLIIGNCLAWLIAPARRALDREAKDFPGTDFRTSNRKLMQLAAVLTPVALVAGILAAVL